MRICLIACLDTKGAECHFLKTQLEQQHHAVLIVNTGIFPSPYKADIVIQQIVGDANDALLNHLAKSRNLSATVQLICNNAQNTIPSLIDLNSVDVVIGMGGANGTLISTTIMRLFPSKTRKLCISTLAPAHLDLTKYKAEKIEMVPSIVDLSGLNIITEYILKYVINLIQTKTPALEYLPTNNNSSHDNAINFLIRYLELLKVIPALQALSYKTIAITMFGNTTPCVEACHQRLSQLNFHVIIFHATGIGGEIMRYLIENKCIKAGVLDITTTELADLICGGSMSASHERFFAPSKHGVPHLIAPGCLDMVNFAPKNSTPLQYATRLFQSWGADMQLMRTNVAENIIMGNFLAEIANQSPGLVELVLPQGGFSILGENGNVFFDQEADMALIETVTKQCDRQNITLIDKNINHPEVSAMFVLKIYLMIQKLKSIAVPPYLHGIKKTINNARVFQQHSDELSSIVPKL